MLYTFFFSATSAIAPFLALQPAHIIRQDHISTTSSSTAIVTASTPKFRVEGNQIKDSHGQEFIPVGFNSVHVWLNENAARQGLAAEISKTKANTVRLVTAGEAWTWNSQSHTSAKKKELVELALKANLVPILELHDGTCVEAYDYPAFDGKMGLKQIVDHWLLPGNAALLKQYSDTLWLNIANEWGPADNPDWKDGYVKSIARLRKAGITNLLVIDAGGCGQDAHSLLKWGNEVAASDPLKKVVLSIHMYGFWVTNDKPFDPSWQFKVEDTLPQLKALKAPVMIGEFGWDTPPGSNSSGFNPNILLKMANDLRLGWLFWAWHSNPEETSLNAVSDPGSYDLTEIGKILVNDPEVGLKALATMREPQRR
jgi:mannan endo-1,4-beta-mannosidase